MCSTIEIGTLFEDKPDELVLAYDGIVQGVSNWQPNSIGASIHTVVMTSQKAWLIIRPMKKELDVKFYYDEILESERLKRVSKFGKKYAHHLRIKDPEELDEEIFELLRMGHEYSLR
ncbi:MAG: DUF5655 domain-containing protein [Bacteroidota bacterium]